MMLSDRSKTIRRGVTLVELLIVVSIITILAAVALPAMQTGMESRRIREAARAVHVYLGSAQVRAIETGRPAGVLLEHTVGNPAAGALLRQVEVPPPYAGDFDDAVVRVQDWTFHPTTGVAYMPGYRVLRVAVRTFGDFGNGLIQPGNMVQLNHQGPLYEIVSPLALPARGQDFDVIDGYIDFTAPNQNGDPLDDGEPDGWWDTHVLTLRLSFNRVSGLPWPIVTNVNTPSYPTPNPTTAGGIFTGQWSAAVSFQITRNPVPSSVPPLNLPREIVVDLGDSGLGSTVFPLTVAGAGPLIMFSPDGQVEQVYTNNVGSPVTWPIFLMIGRRDRVGGPNNPLPEDGLQNWQDAANLWLALNPQTGRVTVAEVSAEQAPGVGNNTTADTYVPYSIFTSRKYARQAQASMRGR